MVSSNRSRYTAEDDWQTADYAPIQDFRFNLPTPFLILCRHWDITPREILTDFMDNLSHGSHNRLHRDEAKQHLQQYILEMAYGHQKYYNVADLNQMFAELDTLGRLWPTDSPPELIALHQCWLERYYLWWFTKWHGPNRQKQASYL